MSLKLTRRELLGGAAAAWMFAPNRPLVDTHIHLFAADQQRFPYHPNAPYKPPAEPLERYVEFAASRIDHVVIVHPEPYQDDHRYLEYCFAHEPRHAFFKGTCLFDPIAPDTPARMEALVKKHSGRIVALRIHQMRKPGEPPTTSGPIKDRDMRHPAMQTTWRKAQELGLAIQMHFIPYYAPQIGELAARFPAVRVILDHLARAGQGTPAEFEEVLRLARLPNVYMKYSGVEYSSKQKYPFQDVGPIVRQAYDAFGPDRMIWGGLGNNPAAFERQLRLFDLMFDFAPEVARAKIRGLTAMKLYGWA
ncbi:MAG: amidohydrolase family protein [Rhodospirillales bacterium]